MGGIARKLDLKKTKDFFSHALYPGKASTDFNSEKNISNLIFLNIFFYFSHC